MPPTRVSSGIGTNKTVHERGKNKRTKSAIYAALHLLPTKIFACPRANYDYAPLIRVLGELLEY